ncbi:glycosyltransferase [Coprobacter fastidiosus]|uniref:glycosyltransferase n=1 Tax=Coprobacter fastidiosus TaxID=1099853 RepID=UPI0018A03756|nr:glycosyltransferase [Coprobacter fastidiosus]
MKKVLQVTAGMNRAGAETMIMNIYRHIDRSKIQFDFIVYSDEKQDYEDEITQLGGSVIHIPINRGAAMVKSIAAIRKILKTNGPYCAIHAATLFNCAYAMLASLFIPNLVRIAHSHNTRNTLNNNLLWKIYESLSRLIITLIGQKLIACGEEAGKYLFGNKFAQKGLVLNNAIDVNVFYNTNEDAVAHLRAELGITDTTLVIGNVARLEEVKNHAKMIEIARQMKSRQIEFKMLFIGRGDLESKIRKDIKRYKLENEVCLLGIRSDVPNLLHTMDVLLMPSHFEGNPVSLIEAQAAGVPCVISSIITDKIDMGLNLVSKVALSSTAEEWVDAILKTSKSIKPTKKQVVISLRNHGYDINETTKLLTDIYLGNR